MSGHVFVVRGDLTRFACDAWLIPTGRGREITRSFWSPRDNLSERLMAARAFLAAPGRAGTAAAREAWGDSLAVPVDPEPLEGPRPWLVRVVGSEPGTAVSGALEFLRRASADPHRFLHSRGKRLLALPVVGTGAGGLHEVAGALVAELLPALRLEAERLDVDIALVAFSEPDHAAAQAVRRATTPQAWWEGLGGSAMEEAKRLGRFAARGRLVVFFGAGLSMGVGLPSWTALLDALAAEAGIEEELRQRLSSLGALDYAQIVARRLKDAGKVEGETISRLFASHGRYGLSHGALASLPVEEFITTNYDVLFEAASEDAGRPVAVLPYAPDARGGRWLLKMHGCVNHPDDVVLTRESYLRYAERNAALAGIVQAMLITRRMLFLGFSLSDDNFHRIVDAVRRALRPGPDASQEVFGTAVTPGSGDLLEHLWKGEIDAVRVPDARSVEMFLDRLAFEAARPSHLLDDRFEAVLDVPDRALRDVLHRVVEAREGVAARSEAWPLVEDLLSRLGSRTGQAGAPVRRWARAASRSEVRASSDGRIFPLGAIAGDVIGSVHEHAETRSTEFELFTPRSRFTDDSVLTAAVADALVNRRDYAEAILEWAQSYPKAGYGGSFRRWMRSEDRGPYGSYGNGSAMRASPVGWVLDSLEEVLEEARRSAEVTHNHPEGIKGAQALAAAVFLARSGASRPEIRSAIEDRFGYDLSRHIADIRPSYSFDVTCQGSVPEALIAFLESSSWEDAVRLAISLGGDADTLACMAGAVAEAFYGEVPPEIAAEVERRLDDRIRSTLREFSLRFVR